MNRKKHLSLKNAVESLYGPGVEPGTERSVGGGCINDTGILTLSNGEKLFIKRNGKARLELFEREADGLDALGAVEGAPRVPEVMALGVDGAFSFLLMEFLPSSSRRKDFWECFGREMAVLHRNGRSDLCGFIHDNHIGATPQINTPVSSWFDFFRIYRIEYQLRLARDRGLADSTMVRAVSRTAEKLDDYLIPPDDNRPSLLHGDLWNGNFLEGPEGRACLIDPAAHFGHREADLAMTELFGGFDRSFYSSYNEAWPLEPGYAVRRDLYNLYHMLNHLNLFGGGYAGSVQAIASRYA